MFVRWKRRALAKSKYGTSRKEAGTLLTASVVESVRIAGKPRQRVLKYLGSIQQWRLEAGQFWPIKQFWEAVAAKLAALKLSKKDTKRLTDQVAAIVPRPTTKMQRASSKERATLEANS